MGSAVFNLQRAQEDTGMKGKISEVGLLNVAQLRVTLYNVDFEVQW